MKEYPAYTISSIESELTWEQLRLLLDLIRQRRERENSESNQVSSRTGKKKEVYNYDIEDIADGKVKGFGFGVERVKKDVNADR